MTTKTFKSGAEARKYFEGLEPIAGGYFDYFAGSADTRKEFADRFTWMNAGDQVKTKHSTQGGCSCVACIAVGVVSCIVVFPNSDVNPVRVKVIREGYKKCRGPQDYFSPGLLKKTERQIAIDEASEIDNALPTTPTRSAATASRL